MSDNKIKHKKLIACFNAVGLAIIFYVILSGIGLDIASYTFSGLTVAVGITNSFYKKFISSFVTWWTDDLPYYAHIGFLAAIILSFAVGLWAIISSYSLTIFKLEKKIK